MIKPTLLLKFIWPHIIHSTISKDEETKCFQVHCYFPQETYNISSCYIVLTGCSTTLEARVLICVGRGDTWY